MLRLYFGNSIAMTSSILLIVNIGYMLWGFINRTTIQKWGNVILLFIILNGLFWYFANMRDLYSNSIVHGVDGSVKDGLFSVKSMQSLVFWIGIITIWILGVFSIFKSEYRKIIFMMIIFIGCVQIFFIEGSRMRLYYISPDYFNYM